MRFAAWITIAFGVVWLLLGSRILLVVDRYVPGLPSPVPAGPLRIDADNFVLAGEKWPFERKTTTDSRGRLVVLSGARAVTFGPPENTGAVVPEPGDAISFTRDSSRFSWQTPFAPRFHRYVYYRLRWTKPFGATLGITWRDRQNFYPGKTGWQDAHTRLLTDVVIHASPIEDAAEAYLQTAKQWARSEYRLEVQPPAAADVVVNAVYLKDAPPVTPALANRSCSESTSHLGRC